MKELLNSRAAARVAAPWLGLVLCGLAGVAAPAMAQPATGSTEVTRKQIDTSLIRNFNGYKAITRPSHDSVMGFALPTRISEVLVRGGQQVTEGQMLVRGDDSEDVQMLELQRLRAETDLPVQQAKKAWEYAVVEYDNLVDARSKGGASVQEVDRAKLTAELRELDWKNAVLQQRQESVGLRVREARVDKFYLKAPFDGTVDLVMVDVGQSVSEQDKVLRVINVDTLWIDVPAPMDDPTTLKLKNGDEAWILLDLAGTGRLAKGTVIEVAPSADPASRTRRIRVELKNPEGPDRLIAGDSAWVRFSAPEDAVAQRLSLLRNDTGETTATRRE